MLSDCHCKPSSISIHAPRVGSDAYASFGDALPIISIHAPRVGSDGAFKLHPSSLTYFNPRSPCGERPLMDGTSLALYLISIHAPRVGSDARAACERGGKKHFNPRSPCGERLLGSHRHCDGGYFNPRSPCGERHHLFLHPAPHRNFNPRSPCGERLDVTCYDRIRYLFQSTLPVWGATHNVSSFIWFSVPFQSTLPVWGATICWGIYMRLLGFQSTLPVWGATVNGIFISPP